MTARDDYPYLADFATRASGSDRNLIEKRREATRALDEIDRLTAERNDFKLRWQHACQRADRLERRP